MLFNSLTFLYFFIAVVAVTYLLPLRARNLWILFAGCAFYLSWSPPFLALLVGTAFVDYFIAQRMGRLAEKADREPWLIASIVFNLGSLAFFKYTTMAFETAATLAPWFGSHWRPPMVDIVLPLGISFYTFETISYSVDVYRGELQPKKNFVEYLSFLMLFPKLIAGPIVRASELLPQIPKDRRVSEDDFNAGMNLLAFGFVKKVLLADNFAPFVEQVFANPSAHNRWMCIVAAYGYSMQVYFDFSAYSDIARGCAKLLGYELPLNFNQPYAATSIADFWRRWHLTLSRWLRDYLYIPLGGGRDGSLLTYRNLFITMLLGGLWHGASWTFVTWGAMNGVLLVGERAWYHLRGHRPKRLEEMGTAEIWLRRIVVFTLITFTRIFFRAPTFAGALAMLKAIARPATNVAEPSFALFAIPTVVVSYILLSRYKEKARQIHPKGFALAGYALAFAVLLVFGASQAQFIYFQF